MNPELNKWLTSLSGFGSQKMEDIGFVPFLVVMGISLLCSLFISFLYVKFYKSRATGSQIHRAFPLLGVSVTAIFICIQFSLPLSLGLLGALSIVRFRTPIKEPEEIGFIMLVIATSICCATFNMVFLGIILAVAVAALVALKMGRWVYKGRLNDGMLIITLPTAHYRDNREKLLELMEKQLPTSRIDSISESQHESVLSYSFIRLEKEAMLELQNKLTEISDELKTNIFFNRSGEI